MVMDGEKDLLLIILINVWTLHLFPQMVIEKLLDGKVNKINNIFKIDVKLLSSYKSCEGGMGLVDICSTCCSIIDGVFVNE